MSSMLLSYGLRVAVLAPKRLFGTSEMNMHLIDYLAITEEHSIQLYASGRSRMFGRPESLHRYNPPAAPLPHGAISATSSEVFPDYNSANYMANTQHASSVEYSSISNRGFGVALDDLLKGFGLYWLWGLLAWSDIKHRYRGSVLGPFWLTLSSAIMIGSLGFLYAYLFKIGVATYLPALSLGILIWGLISTILSEACWAFFREDHIIKQIRLPFSVYIYRMVARNLIIFAHNIIVSIAVLTWFHIPVGWRDLMAIPGLFMILVTGIPLGLILALSSARFRDLPQIVASLLQVIFFVTPIMWDKSLLGAHGWVAAYNPFSAFIDIVRAPLLDRPPDPASWPMAILIFLFSWLAAVPFFARVRSRVAYWM